MPRPAVVVGLGGTGQWVLTWLKRNLLLSNNGKMPGNVKLLEIDTATKLEAGAMHVTASGLREESVQVGDVSLEQDEFVYIGGEAHSLAQSIKEKAYPQMDWFRAERWLNDLPTTAFTLDDGAGRLRQFGRLSIFKDILKEETDSVIWRALNTAIRSVLTATDDDEQRKLEIIIVGSFAGGTGSGLFIDVALLLRILAQNLQADYILRGFFALPNVFTTTPDDEIKARSFAAWRELNRFMVVNSEFPMPLIRYVQNHPTFKINPTQRLFDACYLVDGRKGDQIFAADAKYGAFPAIAEAVSAILDEEAGTKYTQWVFTNLAPEYSRHPNTPMYSSIGTYSLQVPAYFVESISTHRYAQQILLSLLHPSVTPDSYGHLIARGASRHLSLASPDKNGEDPGFAGHIRSRRLLSEKVIVKEQLGVPTLFHRRIAQLLDVSITAQRHQPQIDMLARAGATDSNQVVASESWVSYYPNFEDDPKLADLRKRVNDHINYSVIRGFSRREGQKEEETRSRLRKIPNDMREKFGGMTVSGEEAEEFYGTFGDVLNECKITQLTIFKQVVRLYLLKILMGESEEKPIIARSGKIGYAWDFFDGVANELDDFLKLMKDVRHRREELKPELKLIGLSENAKKYMNTTSGKKLFWLWEHPDVKSAEGSYLQAQQRTLDLRREDILHNFVVQTARQMQDICVSARDELRRWIWHLSIGDDASNLPGLWDEVLTSMQIVRNAHSYDTSIPKVQGLLSDEALLASEDEIAQALRYWNWNVEFDKVTNGIKIQVRIEIPDAASANNQFSDPGALIDPVGRPVNLAKTNQTILLNLARREFVGFAKRTTVADALKMAYPSPAMLVHQVLDKAEPLFSGPSYNPRNKSNLICIQVSPGDPYFFGKDGFEGLLRKAKNLPAGIRDSTYSIQIVGSENPYKLTLVRTDDLYKYDQFGAWRECRLAYAKLFGAEGNLLDPTLMHIFLAEERAAAYERIDFKKTGIYNELSPRIVMFLEDTTALQQFMYLFALGKINDVDGENTYRWELQWDERNTIWLTPGWKATEDQTSRAKPDLLNAVHGFVIIKANQSPSNHKPISDDRDLQKYIENEMSQLGDAHVEIDWLKHMSTTDGVIGHIRKLAFDPSDPGNERKDYIDLARVTEILFADRIKLLEDTLAGSQRFKPFRPKTAST